MSTPPTIGITGHQALSPETTKRVYVEIEQVLEPMGTIKGVSSLAAGSDQLFADVVLSLGNTLEVVVPCAHYERTFDSASDLARYIALLDRAANVVRLSYEEPSEEAFLAAGHLVASSSDVLIAVWDGEPAAGVGGTADVVRFAQDLHLEVIRIWPEGSRRA